MEIRRPGGPNLMLADGGKASSFFSIWMEKMRPEIGTVRHHSENSGKKDNKPPKEAANDICNAA